MMELNRRIEDGEWIAIAADRVPVRGEKTADINFLGHTAPMPQGAWLLASLLKTQVNTLFCVKQNGCYHLKLRRFTDTSSWNAATARLPSKTQCSALPTFWRKNVRKIRYNGSIFMIFGAKTPSETITLTLLNHEKNTSTANTVLKPKFLFFDVDAMHIVWHGNYVKYLETARCAFLSSIGYDYNEMGRQGYSWPIVQMNSNTSALPVRPKNPC